MKLTKKRAHDTQLTGDTSMKASRAKATTLSAAMATAMLMSAGAAQAIEFSNGELSGSFDTTISYGASWRMEERDDGLVAKSIFDPTIFASEPDRIADLDVDVGDRRRGADSDVTLGVHRQGVGPGACEDAEDEMECSEGGATEQRLIQGFTEQSWQSPAAGGKRTHRPR